MFSFFVSLCLCYEPYYIKPGALNIDIPTSGLSLQLIDSEFALIYIPKYPEVTVKNSVGSVLDGTNFNISKNDKLLIYTYQIYIRIFINVIFPDPTCTYYINPVSKSYMSLANFKFKETGHYCMPLFSRTVFEEEFVIQTADLKNTLTIYNSSQSIQKVLLSNDIFKIKTNGIVLNYNIINIAKKNYIRAFSTVEYKQPGDYNLDLQTIQLIPHTTFICHNPYDFDFIVEGENKKFSHGAIFSLNVIKISVANKTSLTKMSFSIISDPFGWVYDCSTMNVYRGTNIFMSISKTKETNMTIQRGNTTCMVFTSPHNVNYNFYAENGENNDNITLYDVYGTKITRIHHTEGFSLNQKTVFFHFKPDLESHLYGYFGLQSIDVLEKNPYNLNFVEENIPSFDGYKQNENAINHIFTKQFTKYKNGVYQIKLNNNEEKLYFKQFSIVAFHNGRAFKGFINNKEILGETKINVINITNREDPVIIQKINDDILYFTVIEYNDFNTSLFSKCSTVDVVLVSGEYGCSNDFVISSDTSSKFHNLASNITMSEKMNYCLLYASETSFNYDISYSEESKSKFNNFVRNKVNWFDQIMDTKTNWDGGMMFSYWQFDSAKSNHAKISVKNEKSSNENFVCGFVKGTNSYTDLSGSIFNVDDQKVLLYGDRFDNDKENTKPKKTKWLIIGISLGAVFSLIVIVIVVVCLIRRKRSKDVESMAQSLLTNGTLI